MDILSMLPSLSYSRLLSIHRVNLSHIAAPLLPLMPHTANAAPLLPLSGGGALHQDYFVNAAGRRIERLLPANRACEWFVNPEWRYRSVRGFTSRGVPPVAIIGGFVRSLTAPTTRIYLVLPDFRLQRILADGGLCRPFSPGNLLHSWYAPVVPADDNSMRIADLYAVNESR